MTWYKQFPHPQTAGQATKTDEIPEETANPDTFIRHCNATRHESGRKTDLCSLSRSSLDILQRSPTPASSPADCAGSSRSQSCVCSACPPRPVAQLPRQHPVALSGLSLGMTARRSSPTQPPCRCAMPQWRGACRGGGRGSMRPRSHALEAVYAPHVVLPA